MVVIGKPSPSSIERRPSSESIRLPGIGNHRLNHTFFWQSLDFCNGANRQIEIGRFVVRSGLRPQDRAVGFQQQAIERQVAPVDHDVSGNQRPGAALGPAPVECRVAISGPVVTIGQTLGHCGLHESVR